ncbi:MAG: hypothetical protein HZA03_07580 [Nitrospinae bacterium]|nr:hypothetical protein [Nitrospinota bacterium]
MKKTLRMLAAALALGAAGTAHATPSTQIWIPSTDIQKYGTVHLGVDTYNTVAKKTGTEGGFSVINYGLTVGVLPPSVSDKLGIEVGLDYRDLTGSAGAVADAPFFYNAKLGLNEGAFGEYSPAFAIGGYDFGGKDDSSMSGLNTQSNIVYGLAAKTFETLGRFSVGYFSGNDKVLVEVSDPAQKANTGILASWDKSLTDKWWAAVDYMGGKSSYGALSFGICYYMVPDASFIVGYDIYNDSNIKPTITFQLDVNFAAFDGKPEHPHHSEHE